MTTEIIGYLAAILTTSSFLPQAMQTLRTRDTKALSLGMYAIFTVGVLLWMIYGIILNNHAIVYANAITFILAASILGFKIYNCYTKRE